jgi:hypothetical protein
MVLAPGEPGLWRSKNVIYEWNFPRTDAAPVTEM